MKKYDVSLSFAGEDRAFVRAVADTLLGAGIHVFYDEYEQAGLWGRDLYQHLDNVYRLQARYCVVFISKEYARRVWTKHELRSAQARAFMENQEYILPARFDDTDVPGLPPTVAYIDLRQTTPHGLAELILAKLATSRPRPRPRPRTGSEGSILPDQGNSLFRGVCPNCDQVVAFELPNASQTLVGMAHGARETVIHPIKTLESFTRDRAELGRCPNCGQVVMKCPRCGNISRREYDPEPCIKCGKHYVHP